MYSLTIDIDICSGILLLTGGIWTLLSAYYNWKIFFDFQRVRRVIHIFFRRRKWYGRLFYGFLGVFMIVLGLLECAGLISPMDLSRTSRAKEPFSKPFTYCMACLLLTLWGLFIYLRPPHSLKETRYTKAEIYTMHVVVTIMIFDLIYMILFLSPH